MGPDGKPRMIDVKKVPEFQEKGWRVCPQYMSEQYYPQFDQTLNPLKGEDDPRQHLVVVESSFDENKLGILVV